MEAKAPYRAAYPQAVLLDAARELLAAHQAVKDAMKPVMLTDRDFFLFDAAMERQQAAIRALEGAVVLASEGAERGPGCLTPGEAESDFRQSLDSEPRPESCLRCRGTGKDKCLRCHGSGLESEAHRV